MRLDSRRAAGGLAAAGLIVLAAGSFFPGCSHNPAYNRVQETEFLDEINRFSPSVQVPVTVVGAVAFERVPVLSDPPGLDFAGIVQQPARGIRIEVFASATRTSLATGVTDDVGAYRIELGPQPAGTRIGVQAVSEMVSPRMDFAVIDNTSNGALYAVPHPVDRIIDARQELYDFGTLVAVDQTRASAPFAILDTVRRCVDTVLAVRPGSVFPRLRLNWSTRNVPVNGDFAEGEIGGTFFTGPEIFLLGSRDIDAEEYDRHVIAHEMGHYMVASFSRDDSIGGFHTTDLALDIRVAFSEGFASAFAGIVHEDPALVDTSGVGASTGFVIDVERNLFAGEPFDPQGFFGEGSCGAIVWDLHDGVVDRMQGESDNVTLGFDPLWTVMVDDMPTIPKPTYIHEFLRLLRARQPGLLAAINDVAEMELLTTTVAGATEMINPAEDAEPPVTFGTCNGDSAVVPYPPIIRLVAFDQIVTESLDQVCGQGNPVSDNLLFGTGFYLIPAGTGTLDILFAGPGSIGVNLTRRGTAIPVDIIRDSRVRAQIDNADLHLFEVRHVVDPDNPGAAVLTMTFDLP